MHLCRRSECSPTETPPPLSVTGRYIPAQHNHNCKTLKLGRTQSKHTATPDGEKRPHQSVTHTQMRSNHTNPQGHSHIPIPSPLEAQSFLSHINTTDHTVHGPETRPRHHTLTPVTQTPTQPSHSTSDAITHFKHSHGPTPHTQSNNTQPETQLHGSHSPTASHRRKISRSLTTPRSLTAPHNRGSRHKSTSTLTCVLPGRVPAAPTGTGAQAPHAPRARTLPSRTP